ncbi:MAG: putative transcriptional regulator, PucR family [Actinomycetia bacterium]|nr:putative transcriptional regulator, PucR family [Actinomycetes bacterium]
MVQDRRFQAELEALAVRIGHSVTVDDPTGRLIAYSVQDAFADEARIASILLRQVPLAIQEWQNLHGISEATAPVRVPANPQLGMTERVCVPIRRGRSCMGYLWVLEAGAVLDDAAIEAAVRSAHELADALEGQPGTPPAQIRNVDWLVRRFLGDAPAPAAVRELLVAAVPSLLEADIQVCVAVPCTPQREAVSALRADESRRLAASLAPSMRRRPAYVGSYVTATPTSTTAASTHDSEQPATPPRYAAWASMSCSPRSTPMTRYQPHHPRGRNPPPDPTAERKHPAHISTSAPTPTASSPAGLQPRVAGVPSFVTGPGPSAGGAGRSGLRVRCPGWSGCPGGLRRSAMRSPAPARSLRLRGCVRYPAG